MQYTDRYGVWTHSNAGAHSAGELHEAYCPPLPVGPEQIGIPACCGTQCLLAPHPTPGFIGSQFMTPEPVDAAADDDDDTDTDTLTDEDALADDALEALALVFGPEEPLLCWHCP